jgi:hypothetical protein
MGKATWAVLDGVDRIRAELCALRLRRRFPDHFVLIEEEKNIPLELEWQIAARVAAEVPPKLPGSQLAHVQEWLEKQRKTKREAERKHKR